jgi:sodium/pantothenate symporter
MLSGIAIGVFLWQQYAVTLAGFAERFALPSGAIYGAYLLAIGCGSMLLLAGGVGYWVVRPRHQKAAAARTPVADTH